MGEVREEREKRGDMQTLAKRVTLFLHRIQHTNFFR